MNISRIFGAWLTAFLLPMFSAHAASASPALVIPEKGSVRFLHYWSEYGERSSRPEGLERIRFELSSHRLYFSQGRPAPDTFQCTTDGSLNREIVPLLSSLDFTDWPGQMEQSAVFDLPDQKKEKLCRWHISAVFEPEKPGERPLQFSFYGTDDGTSPKRLAVEQKLAEYFREKISMLKAVTPRHLDSLVWMRGDEVYRLEMRDSGVLELSHRKGSERVRMAVYTALALELEDLIRCCGLEKFQGFVKKAGQGEEENELHVIYDTRQQIHIVGHSGPEGMPDGFSKTFTVLGKMLAEAASPSGITRALPATTLKSLFFMVFGMSIGENIELYERMDKDGPVLVLSKNIGNVPDNRKEAVLDAGQLSELEKLLEQYNVRSWDGFRRSPRMKILDGERFSLGISFRDGTRIEANGENRYPAGYHDFRSELNRFADSVLGPLE